MKALKILIVSHEYPPIGGGGANACVHLAECYAKSGNEVTIVSAWYPGQLEIEQTTNILIYRVKSRRKHAEHCSFFEMLDFLVKACHLSNKIEKANHYDICQVFFGVPSGPIGLYLKKKYGLPYVIRLGGGDIPGFQKRFTVVYKLIGPAIKLIWRHSDALVANSQGLKDMAERFYSRKEILVISNGAEANESQKESEPIGRMDFQTIHLLFVSRLIERKGLQDFLPQLKTIADNCAKKGKNVVLDIVGDGPYRSTLEGVVEQLMIDDMVVFHGLKSKAELPTFYSAADLFVFPSRKEGMPNAVLEAMSFGLPIIMTACEGSKELISTNGFICEVKDFSKHVTELALDDDKRNQMSKESKRLVQERFTWESIANAYLRIFSTLT